MGGQKQLTQLYFSLLPAQSRKVGMLTAQVSGGFRKEPVAVKLSVEMHHGREGEVQ
jgi:hypothetical protein